MNSFNGIEFKARAIHSSGIQDLVAIHEIIGSKYGPYLEVMGKGIEVYECDAFMKDDFNVQLLQLAVQQTKWGVLTLEGYGIIKAICVNFSMSRDAYQHGIVNLRMTFFKNNNSHYKIGTSTAHGLAGLVDKAANFVSSFNVSDLGSTVTSILGSGGSYLSSVSGCDALLSQTDQTAGRFFQSGTLSDVITSGASSLNDITQSVTKNITSIIGSL